MAFLKVIESRERKLKMQNERTCTAVNEPTTKWRSSLA
jgi:hypothetical protein